MKRNVIAGLFAASMAVGAPRPALANDCTSALGVFTDAWKIVDKAARQLGCGIVDKATGQVVDYSDCMKAAETAQKLQGLVFKLWNEVHGNGPGTIGPRMLSLAGVPETGTLRSVGERIFWLPPATKDQVTIAIRKTDGKEAVNLTICSTDAKQKSTPMVLRTGEFKNGSGGAPWIQTVGGVKGKVLLVHIAATRVNLLKFAYLITATEK